MKRPKLGRRAGIYVLAVGLVAVAMVTAAMTLGGAEKLAGERNVKASKPLFVPDVGKTNVYCSGGLAPMEPFKSNGCKPAPTEGTFEGTFLEGKPLTDSRDEGGIERSNSEAAKADFTATFTNPIDGKQYRIVSKDTEWNSTTTAQPTAQPFFTKPYGNVFYDQIQHGQSMVDRSDAPLLFTRVGMYGHVDVMQGDKVVAKNIFTHVMVAYVLGGPNEKGDDQGGRNEFFSHLKISPQSPLFVFIFVVNTPGTIQATPPPSDPSLHQGPPFDHDDHSSPWPVDDPSQPLYFNFLIYQETQLTM